MQKAANPPSHRQARPAHKWPRIGANVHTTWESGKRVSAVFISRRDYPGAPNCLLNAEGWCLINISAPKCGARRRRNAAIPPSDDPFVFVVKHWVLDRGRVDSRGVDYAQGRVDGQAGTKVRAHQREPEGPGRAGWSSTRNCRSNGPKGASSRGPIKDGKQSIGSGHAFIETGRPAFGHKASQGANQTAALRRSKAAGHRRTIPDDQGPAPASLGRKEELGTSSIQRWSLDGRKGVTDRGYNEAETGGQEECQARAAGISSE